MCVVLAACSAPEPSNPILEMFNDVPQSATEETLWISYIDYEAAWGSRGLTPPTRQQMQDRDWFRQYAPATGYLLSDLRLMAIGIQFPEMYEVVGFTSFDVHREVTFGQPPRVGIVLAGEFDEASIEAALVRRGYSESEVAGASVWCGLSGCEGGMVPDPDNREHANPFGGNNGRQEPLLVGDNLLLNSADIDVFTALIEAHQGDQPSLSDLPDYRAMAEAAHDLGSTVQLHIYPRAEAYWESVNLRDDLDPALAEALLGFGSLPEYSLFGTADIWDGEQQIAALLLVYESADAAEAGGAELHHRLMTGRIPDRAMTSGINLVEWLAEKGGQLQPPMVVESSTGKAIAVVMFTYPLPEMEGSEDPITTGLARGRVYQRLVGLYAVQLRLYLVRDVQP